MLVVVAVADRHVDDAVGEVRRRIDRDDLLVVVDAGRVEDGRAAGVGLAQRQDRRQVGVAREFTVLVVLLDGLSESERDVGVGVRRRGVVERIEGGRRRPGGIHREGGAVRRALVARRVVVAVADRHVDVALGEVGGGVDGDDRIGGVDAGRVVDVRAADAGRLQRQDRRQVGVAREINVLVVLLDRLVEGQRDVRPRIGHRGARRRVERRGGRPGGVHREGGVVRRALVARRVVVAVGHRHVDVALGEVRRRIDGDDRLGGVDAGSVADVRAADAGRLQRQDRRQVGVAREINVLVVLLDRLSEGQRDVGARVRRRGVVERIEGGLRRSRGINRERRAGRRAQVAVGVVGGVGDPHVDVAVGEVAFRVDGDDRLGAVDGRFVGDGRAAGVRRLQRQDAVDTKKGTADRPPTGAVAEVPPRAVRLDRLAESQRDVRRRVRHRDAIGRGERRGGRPGGVHREGGAVHGALVARRVVVAGADRHVDVAVGEVRGGGRW